MQNMLRSVLHSRKSLIQVILLKLLKLHRNCKIFLKTQIRFVCTIVANLLAVQKVICVSSEFHVFSSVKWHLTV